MHMGEAELQINRCLNLAQYRYAGESKNIFPLPGIKPRFLCHPALNLVNTQPELSQLLPPWGKVRNPLLLQFSSAHHSQKWAFIDSMWHKKIPSSSRQFWEAKVEWLPRHRWEDNIKMDLKRLDGGGMDLINLAQDRTGGELSWMRLWTFGFHIMQGISWVA
jgi:hypothetical protein